jgi:hypothetical protein
MKIDLGPRFRGIAAASLVCVMALAACGDSAGKSNADLLKEAATNMKAVKTYHLNADIDQAGQAVKLVGDFDVTNKNVKLDLDTAGQKVSVIQVGEKVYLSTDGGTTYTESPGGAAMMEGFGSFTDMWNTFEPAKVDQAKDALKDGTPATETIDGVSTKHITADAKQLSLLGSSTGTDSTEGTLDMWIGPNDKPYVRQMKIDGTSGGQPIKATITWSKIGEAMDIKAP